MKTLWGVSAFALILAGGACKTEKPAPKSGVAEELPAFEDPEEPAYVPVRRELSAAQQALIFDSPLRTLTGEETSLAAFRGKTLMVVNVASQCGLTPQYKQLQGLQAKYEPQGFSVVAFPCNQFGGQEPGTDSEILSFGKDNYQVTFPLMEKIETNGADQHPIYQALTSIGDDSGNAGDVAWNFEKFLVSADGAFVTRIRPQIAPDDPAVVELLTAELAR
jgi:glutathione peroxidase